MKRFRLLTTGQSVESTVYGLPDSTWEVLLPMSHYCRTQTVLVVSTSTSDIFYPTLDKSLSIHELMAADMLFRPKKWQVFETPLLKGRRK